MPFLFTASEKARGFPLPSIFRCLHAKYSQKMMRLLRGFPSLSEHNLRNVQLHEDEVEAE